MTAAVIITLILAVAVIILLTVFLADGKKTVLTDSAMEHTGGFLLSSRELPDEDVPLYNAYRLIQAERK